MPVLTIAGSGTAIEDEYRFFTRAIARCKANDVAFEPGRYAPAAVAAARAMWRVRMRAEHESVPVFLSLAGQLIEANATLDAQGVMLRMAADEVRHTEICGEAVRALGGDPACEVALPLAELPRHPGCGPEERAIRNVIFGCCFVEMVNTANLVDVLDRMSDPFLSESTRLLLADEVQHGSFGYDYLEAWAPWLAARPDVRASIDVWLRSAFGAFERMRSGVGAPARTLTVDEIALGLPDPARLPEVFFQTVQAAILPALSRFGLDATTAWNARA
jgi:hypothetical protein